MTKLNVSWDTLTQFRHEMHQHPELSGEEQQTPQRILQFLERHAPPDEVVQPVGKTGLAVVYHGRKAGPTVGIRADMDALPIQEEAEHDYPSQVEEVAHLCGHDGHTTMVLGLALTLAEQRPPKGKVVLVFQPAEETGQGAAWLIADPKFKALKLDYMFGLHNLPGKPRHAIVLSHPTFAAASKGMKIKLIGRTSHAAEPHNGNSPAVPMARLVGGLSELVKKEDYEDFTLLTVTHARLGEPAFGITPGRARVYATLRGYRDEDVDRLTENAEVLARHLAEEAGLKCKIEYDEVFPATINHEEASERMRRAAEAEGLEVVELEHPMTWSEDFGQYRELVPITGFFGLGAGKGVPELHHESYNFPDEIIPTGVGMFHRIVHQLLAE